MKRLDKLHISTLAAWAIITVLLALAMASPYLPHTVLHAQSVGFGGVPGGSSGGAVSSVFGRTGAVVAASGDYTATQVTNAAATNVSNTFAANQIIAAASPFFELQDTSNSNQISQLKFGLGYTYMYSNSYNAVFMWSTKPGVSFFVPPTEAIGWANDDSGQDGPDTAFSRVSATVVAVGNGNQGDASGTLEAATLSTTNLTLGGTPIIQAATAPSGSCSAVEWVLSNDGGLTFCNGTTYVAKIAP